MAQEALAETTPLVAAPEAVAEAEREGTFSVRLPRRGALELVPAQVSLVRAELGTEPAEAVAAAVLLVLAARVARASLARSS